MLSSLSFLPSSKLLFLWKWSYPYLIKVFNFPSHFISAARECYLLAWSQQSSPWVKRSRAEDNRLLSWVVTSCKCHISGALLGEAHLSRDKWVHEEFTRVGLTLLLCASMAFGIGSAIFLQTVPWGHCKETWSRNFQDLDKCRSEMGLRPPVPKDSLKSHQRTTNLLSYLTLAEWKPTTGKEKMSCSISGFPKTFSLYPFSALRIYVFFEEDNVGVNCNPVTPRMSA